MIQSNNVEIHSIGLHKVGNKYMDEPLELSTEYSCKLFFVKV